MNLVGLNDNNKLTTADVYDASLGKKQSDINKHLGGYEKADHSYYSGSTSGSGWIASFRFGCCVFVTFWMNSFVANASIICNTLPASVTEVFPLGYLQDGTLCPLYMNGTTLKVLKTSTSARSGLRASFVYVTSAA